MSSEDAARADEPQLQCGHVSFDVDCTDCQYVLGFQRGRGMEEWTQALVERLRVLHPTPDAGPGRASPGDAP